MKGGAAGKVNKCLYTLQRGGERVEGGVLVGEEFPSMGATTAKSLPHKLLQSISCRCLTLQKSPVFALGVPSVQLKKRMYVCTLHIGQLGVFIYP